MRPVICALLYSALFLSSAMNGSVQEETGTTPAVSEGPPGTGDAAAGSMDAQRPAVSEAAMNPEVEIQAIRAKQEAIRSDIAEATAKLVVEEATPSGIPPEYYQSQLELLRRIGITLKQQITVLDQYQNLQQQKEMLDLQLRTVANEGVQDQNPSFLEYDRVRGVLLAERNREAVMQSKYDIAKTSLDNAEQTLGERRIQLSVTQDKININQDESQRQSLEMEFETDRIQAQLAGEIHRLRQLEFEFAKSENEAHQTWLRILEINYADLRRNAKFTEDDLNRIQEQLEEEERTFNRRIDEITTANGDIQARLSEVRREIGRGDPSPELRAEERSVVVEFEANQHKLVTIQTKLELIVDRKTAWQRRYELFNDLAGKDRYESWRQEALEEIGDMESRLRLIMTDLSINQNTIAQLGERIDGTGGEPGGVLEFLLAQRESFRSVSQTFLDRQNEFQKNLRLHDSLVNEINERAASLSLEERIEQILQYRLMSNPVRAWIMVIAIFLAVLLGMLVVRWILANRLEILSQKKDAMISPFILKGVNHIGYYFFFMVAVFYSTRFLEMPVAFRENLEIALYFVLAVQGGILANYILRSWLHFHLARRSKNDNQTLGALSIFNFIIQTFIWSIVVLSVLQAMGYDVTTLIAGLGVGGVAVALALQKILGDLFSSLSIVFDKPFLLGDFINVNNNDILGTVEHIGLKTTRVRSLSGEQIVCANSHLLDSQIRNYKRMRERRIAFHLGVVYQTSCEHMKRIPEMLKDIVTSVERTRFDRAHFKDYGDFSLNFEIVYYILSSDYTVYMDIQQEINLQILQRFREDGIEFAYPTSVTYLNQDNPIRVISPSG